MSSFSINPLAYILINVIFAKIGLLSYFPHLVGPFVIVFGQYAKNLWFSHSDPFVSAVIAGNYSGKDIAVSDRFAGGPQISYSLS